MTPEEKKESLRAKRREAYLAAKERQKSDPKYIAMKEKQKEARRAAYQKQKQQRAEYMKAAKATKNEEDDKSRAERDVALSQYLMKGSDLAEPSENS